MYTDPYFLNLLAIIMSSDSSSYLTLKQQADAVENTKNFRKSNQKTQQIWQEQHKKPATKKVAPVKVAAKVQPKVI